MSERLLRVRVQPRAPRSEIVGWRADGTLSVRVAAPPVEGQANAALTTLLSRALRVPPSWTCARSRCSGDAITPPRAPGSGAVSSPRSSTRCAVTMRSR